MADRNYHVQVVISSYIGIFSLGLLEIAINDYGTLWPTIYDYLCCKVFFQKGVKRMKGDGSNYAILVTIFFLVKLSDDYKIVSMYIYIYIYM